MDDCIFCKIVAGELPSTRVYEDDRVVAIMDIFPATRGHALVIPRAHARDVHEVAQDDLAAAAAAAKHLAGAAGDEDSHPAHATERTLCDVSVRVKREPLETKSNPSAVAST